VLVHRLQQPRPHTAPAKAVHDGDRELRRLRIDVAVAVLLLGEEPVPDRSDPSARLLGDEAGISRTPPAAVVHRDRVE
jgi:hypothetical protein